MVTQFYAFKYFAKEFGPWSSWFPNSSDCFMKMQKNKAGKSAIPWSPSDWDKFERTSNCDSICQSIIIQFCSKINIELSKQQKWSSKQTNLVENWSVFEGQESKLLTNVLSDIFSIFFMSFYIGWIKNKFSLSGSVTKITCHKKGKVIMHFSQSIKTSPVPSVLIKS